MKKLLLLILVCAAVLCGCKENVTNFTGQYGGVFTTTRSEENVSFDTSATVMITQVSENSNDLVLQQCFHLTEIESASYEFSEKNEITEEMRNALYQMCGINEHYFTSEISRVQITVRFYSTTVAIKIRFSSTNGYIGHSTFTGSK